MAGASFKFAWLRHIATDPRCSAFQVRVAVVIATDASKETGEVSISLTSLAEQLGATRNGVQQALCFGPKALTALGYLDLVQPGRGGRRGARPAVYRLRSSANTDWPIDERKGPTAVGQPDAKSANGHWQIGQQPLAHHKEDSVSSRTTPPSAHDLFETLIKAGGDALNRSALQARGMSDPLAWLDRGCSLDLDVLPVISAKATGKKHGAIRSWTYFADAVAEAHERRTASPKRNGDAKPVDVVRVTVKDPRWPALAARRNAEHPELRPLRGITDKANPEERGWYFPRAWLAELAGDAS